MRDTMVRIGGIVLAVFAAGCPEMTYCERAALEDQTLVLGHGEHDFVALQDGDTLDPTFGNQGGQHLYVSVQAVGIDPGQKRPLMADLDVPQLTVRMTRLSDGGLAGVLEAPDWIAWNGDQEVAELIGEELRFSFPHGDDDSEATTGPEPVQPTADEYLLEAELTDACGATLTDERVVWVTR